MQTRDGVTHELDRWLIEGAKIFNVACRHFTVRHNGAASKSGSLPFARGYDAIANCRR
jgi:hypothetical protein